MISAGGRSVYFAGDTLLVPKLLTLTAARQPFTYRSFPQIPHSMHEDAPDVYASTLTDWAATLDLD